MKFKIKTEHLIKILRKMNNIIPNISYMIEETGILILVYKNKIIFYGKKENTKIKIVENDLSNIYIENEGKVLIKNKIFFEIINSINEEFVEFNKFEKNMLSISSKTSNYQINLLNEENYTDYEFKNNNNFSKLSINYDKFRKLVNNVIFAANEKSNRIILQGINLIKKDNKIKMISSDNLRVAYSSIDLKPEETDEKEINAIIHVRSIKEILKIYENVKKINFYFGEDYLFIEADQIYYKTKLIQGHFPSLENVFYKEEYNVLKISNRKLIELIEKAVVLNINGKYSENIDIRLIIDEKNLKIEAKEEAIGFSNIYTSEFEFKESNPGIFQISFNPKLVIESLKVNQEKDAVINFKDGKSPFVITGDKNRQDKSLILPFINM